MAPMSLTLRLEDELDVSRGELICRPDEAPDGRARARGRRLLDDRRAAARRARATCSSTPRALARAIIDAIDDLVDVHTLERADRRPRSSALNDIGRVRLRTQRAARVRPLHEQPPHRQLHPDRRGQQRHRRRGDDRRRRLRSSAACTGSPSRPEPPTLSFPADVQQGPDRQPRRDRRPHRARARGARHRVRRRLLRARPRRAARRARRRGLPPRRRARPRRTT